MDSATASALLEESAKRAGVIWVRRAASDHPATAMWHAWSDGNVYLLVGGHEQAAPMGLLEPGAVAEVTVASKDKGSRLLTWLATVEAVAGDSPEWDAVIPALNARRLNSPDGDAAKLRWVSESIVLRLAATGQVLSDPDSASS